MLATNSLWMEHYPETRRDANALVACSVLNAFVVDCEARKHVISNFNQGIMQQISPPNLVGGGMGLLTHAGLRLIVNDELFAALWREQLGDAWREPGRPPFTWPVLAGDDERWAVRAAIDAVVADAYGLSREQYAHVLSTFSHASYKKAPELCLAAFDELKAIGLDAFCKKHDPYHDIPLVETLPKPVIDLPIPADGDGQAPGRRRRGSHAAPDQPTLWDGKAEEPAKPAGPDPGKVLAAKTLLEMQKELTSAELQKKFGYEPTVATAVLKQLVEQGLATVEGKARAKKYRWRNR